MTTTPQTMTAEQIRLCSLLGSAAHDDDVTVETSDLRAVLDELTHLRAENERVIESCSQRVTDLQVEFALHDAVRDRQLARLREMGQRARDLIGDDAIANSTMLARYILGGE